MANFQQTILIGHVGKEPDMRYTPSNAPVCTFSVAVTEKWTDKGSKEKREKTTWYRVTAWNGLAETANSYVKKGMQIMVVGKVEARGYKDSAGEAKASLELTATSFQFLGGGNGASNQDVEVDYSQVDFGDVPSKQDDSPF